MQYIACCSRWPFWLKVAHEQIQKRGAVYHYMSLVVTGLEVCLRSSDVRRYELPQRPPCQTLAVVLVGLTFVAGVVVCAYRRCVRVPRSTIQLPSGAVVSVPNYGAYR